MATILLQPGEHFEHMHNHLSTTRLVSGELEMRMAGQLHILTAGQTIEVPADTSHALYNRGRVPAEVHCAHRDMEK
jgi:mannose-6-phosphate isomerase-like protein (cupin superfamily)